MPILRRFLVFIFFGQFFFVSSQVDFNGSFSEGEIGSLLQFSEELKDRYLRSDLDSMRLLAEFLTNRDDELVFLGYRYMGSYYSRKGRLSEALTLFRSSRVFFNAYDDYGQLSEITNEMGNANYQLSNLQDASENYIESLRFGLKSEDVTAAFNGIIGLGKTVCANGDTVLGITLISVFLEKCVSHRKFESAADACAFLGMIFSDLGDKPVAKMYYEQSINLAKRSKSKTHIANVISNQAIVNVENGDMFSAERNFIRALECRVELGAKKPIIDANFNLGTFNIMNENYGQAYNYLMRASSLAKEAGMIRDEYDAIEVILLALPKTVSARDYKLLKDRFKVLEQILANKKEISFEVSGLSSQIASTGSAEVLSVKKIDKTFWLWLGCGMVAISSFFVFFLNRSKQKPQFSR